MSVSPFTVTAQRLRGEEPLDPARVLSSIDRAISFLKRQQQENGSWEDPVGYPGGITALCTLALLHAGLDNSDPSVAKAVEHLRKVKANKTYVVALQTMVFCLAEPKQDRLRIQRNVQWLERAQVSKGKQAGGWGYDQEDDLSADQSNAQFAVLALFEAQVAGAKVQPQTWQAARKYWRKSQNEDGSWQYPSESPSGSITCAGVGSLIMCDLALGQGDAKVDGDKINCCLPHAKDDAIERGLVWLSRNFSIRRNPGGKQWHFYYLYALERVGRLSANRFIGQHDWYREGTAYLVNTQGDPSNSWSGFGIESNYEQISTSFALLFLSKGRRPILLAKLKHGDPKKEVWNHHRQDAAHLVHEAEEAWQLPMTWQVVDAEQASREDLQQSPVLYISGTQIEALVPHAKKLREYIDRGGFLFAESCCGDDSQSHQRFGQLVDAMFPEPEYGLRQIRPEHPIWRMEKNVRGASPYVGTLWAVEYGCRTSVIFCDQDLSCYWELDSIAKRDSYSDTARVRIEDARTVGLNVLAYATNREPKGKEQQFIQKLSDLEIGEDELRGVIRIAKLQHTGGCNDAPGALTNLIRAASEGEIRLRIAPEPQLMSLENPALVRHHFSFMHGRTDFRFSVAEQAELRDYLQNGGTLLADSICSSNDFTKSFRREVSKALGDRPLQAVPADDPILTTAFGGFDIRRVEFRTPSSPDKDRPLTARVRKTTPRLEGIKVDGRWAVIFSPYDLSCALEQHEAVQCRGYRREDAARIGLNVMLYSINQ